jgi:hypothetical protein
MIVGFFFFFLSVYSFFFTPEVRIHAEKEERIRVAKPLEKHADSNRMAVESSKEGGRVESDDEEEEEVQWESRVTRSVRATPFFVLQLNPPPAPIFKDAKQTNIIPQVHGVGRLRCVFCLCLCFCFVLFVCLFFSFWIIWFRSRFRFWIWIWCWLGLVCFLICLFVFFFVLIPVIIFSVFLFSFFIFVCAHV